jgi:hypothetical protein
MQKTRIIKEDGRYLIFYTFEEEPKAQQSAVDGDQQPESDSKQAVTDND